jgi:N-dimethylarginine dimethylaminohydrolase
VFVHDPAIVTDHGAVILRMGKVARRGEEEAMADRLVELGVPILGRLRAPATAEGGDLVWLDHDTLAVGQGLRTNTEGHRQLEDILRPIGVDTVPVALPDTFDPDGCLHLMSLMSMIDHDLAVGVRPRLPDDLLSILQERGVELVEVPSSEISTLAPNVLAMAPRRCLMVEGSPITAARLEQAGCTVASYPGRELGFKAEGGPTCLTRPILRAG